MNRSFREIFPLVLAIVLCTIISACMSPEQIALQREQQNQEDHQTCVGYGLRPGSEAFGNCRLQLDLAREQRYNNYNSYYPHTHFSYHHWN